MKLYRLVTSNRGKANEQARSEALKTSLGSSSTYWEARTRLALGWAAYVDTIAAMDDLRNVGIDIVEIKKPPAAVKAPAAGARSVMPQWERLTLLLKKGTGNEDRGSLASLRAPALQEDVVAIEKEWKLKLPDDFMAWLALHDGGAGPDGGGPLPWGLMSLAFSAWSKRQMQSIAKGVTDYEIEDDDEAVRPVYWHKAWWPFSASGAGDFKCLDLAPTKAGTSGQVIEWPHDDNRRTLEETSFAAYLQKFADGLESGEYVIERGIVIHQSHAARRAKAAKKSAAKRSSKK